MVDGLVHCVEKVGDTQQYLKWQIGDIPLEKTLTCLRVGYLKRDSERILLTIQNNDKMTNYVKGEFDITQQNRTCRLERDEMVKYIESESMKLAQKELKTRYTWVRKGINREWCKILNFEHTTK